MRQVVELGSHDMFLADVVGIEAQSVMAFHIFARTTKVMFEAGVAVQLRRLGYNYVKVNAEVVN